MDRLNIQLMEFRICRSQNLLLQTSCKALYNSRKVIKWEVPSANSNLYDKQEKFNDQKALLSYGTVYNTSSKQNHPNAKPN
ncbi:hypothetical protein RND71_033157 [Anisodus tanguticus]|uniref:Uncharacterized protein n=1 Tax=Anisodus tanguticus TaxID=243964 RepID=A0AAE1R8Q9_9SOLA|nr:hypothetical protein RND71_033157 [Anisodus tanguticus]